MTAIVPGRGRCQTGPAAARASKIVPADINHAETAGTSIRRHRAMAIAATPNANAPTAQSSEEKDTTEATGMNRDYNLRHP